MINSSIEKLKATTLKLKTYCQTNNWEGYDPYDALNSKIFEYMPFANFRLSRLALTQILKRSPFNFRQILLIPKTQNPKAIALFLMSFIKLSRLGLLDHDDLIEMMIEKIVSLRSQNTPHWCWGYSFPWQTRTVVVPRYAPNLVCTTFVANALLDAYENKGKSHYLTMAKSAAAYIINDLYWTENSSIAGFSYPLPELRTKVHNANFLGSALLCRVYKHYGEKKFLDPALKVARYSAEKQHDNGSWNYGELSTQRWIDNFHTGYNLCALRTICECAGTSEFDPHIRSGFKFYLEHFFREDGAPKYFHDRIYPIDIHSVAQSIVTLLVMRDLDYASVRRAFSVFRWAMAHMWDNRGYFYYQVHPFYMIRIPYMRWSQAWMLLAVSMLLEYCETDENFFHTTFNSE
jgi:hypothetical protein